MKKIFTIIAFLAYLTTFAQGAVSRKVTELIGKGTTFKHYDVLNATGTTPNAQVREVLDRATFATLRMADLAQLVANKDEYIEVAIPYNGHSITVQMYRANIFAEGFHIDTDKAKSINYEPGVYYRGVVKNDPTSVVALNFFNNEMSGVVSTRTWSNVVIGKLDRPNNVSDYIIYSDADMKARNNFECHVKDEIANAIDTNRNTDTAQPETTRCVTMYLEIDYNLYQQNNNNTTTTGNWVTSVFNNVQTLYTNDEITVALKSTYIWTTDDPYEGDSSSDYLFQFNGIRPVFDGDVGQLLGIDPGGLGGVAVTINGLCSQDNFSYSDVAFSYSTVPTYSWTIMVITHEFGHLLGSPHTHACVWNGNSTPIDNCGPSAIGEEGEGFSCMSDPPIIPSSAVKGTIMSYCHLVSGVGIGFTNGFGPQPKARVISRVNAGTCLSTDCVNTCINTVANIVVTNPSPTSALVTWEEQGGATAWKVAVTPLNGNNPTWVDVSTNSYSVSGLLANTFYRVWVRPNCDFGLTAPNEQYIFVTSTSYCNGVTITDTGGTANDYDDSETYVRVMIPNLPNKKIKLTFTAFDLEEDYDYLYIYDGNSTSAPDLSAGGFTGNNGLPGPFTSTAADGSLTLKFYSDGGVVEAGYVASVACENNLATNNFDQNIDFTYFPNPTNGLVSIVSKTAITEISVYNVEGRLLYQNKENALNAKVDIGAFATGTYFFKLKFNDKQANFKILKSN